MTDKLKSPYPYAGGKSTIADQIWSRLGDPPNFVEPFMGSAAVLLARPHDITGKTETANDIDGFCVNALRAITYMPEETAYWCDWPVSEACLTSAHVWLKSLRPDLTDHLFADPEYCDPKVAGRWLYGAASWIGDGWCVADGPWINVDGRLVDRRVVGSDADGVQRKMPEVAAWFGGKEHNRGVQQHRASVPRQMPQVAGDTRHGGATNRKGVQAYRHHAGVPRQMPRVGANPDDNSSGKQGVAKFPADALAAYFARLSDRLRRVRFLCGDWRRAVKPSVTVNHGTTGIFLDPEYPSEEHDMSYHEAEKRKEGEPHIWYKAAAWAIENGDDPRLRICIAGYFSEATDALFPATWERVRWEARGGYANQKADGRGRANAKREVLFFSPNCIDAKTDYGPLFAQEDD